MPRKAGPNSPATASVDTVTAIEPDWPLTDCSPASSTTTQPRYTAASTATSAVYVTVRRISTSIPYSR